MEFICNDSGMYQSNNMCWVKYNNQFRPETWGMAVEMPEVLHYTGKNTVVKACNV